MYDFDGKREYIKIWWNSESVKTSHGSLSEENASNGMKYLSIYFWVAVMELKVQFFTIRIDKNKKEIVLRSLRLLREPFSLISTVPVGKFLSKNITLDLWREKPRQIDHR